MTPAPQPHLDHYPYATHLAALDVVEGITLCGSARLGISDEFSDLDLWIFVSNSTPLSEGYVMDHMLPTGARQELLFEGRDGTLVQHLVLNLLTDSRIVNLKIMHTRVLTTFIARAHPSLDPQFLEDLENYTSMELLYDPKGTLALHTGQLKDAYLTPVREWLTPLIANRYASLYWRSIYQGLFRHEPAAWRHLMGGLLELLAYQNAVNAGRLPSPAKWLFSPTTGLAGLPDIVEMQRIVGMADATQSRQVGLVYKSLLRVESDVWGQCDLPHGLWWHAVFMERLPNLIRATGNKHLEALARDLPAEFRATP